MKEILALIPIEITCTVISASFSAAVSWLVSKRTCKHEIEKLKLTWEHEESKTFNESFEAMTYSVTQFSKLGSNTTWREALAHIATVRAASPDEIAYSLDGLYNVVSRRQMKGSEVALTKAIEAKRNYDTSKQSSNYKATE